MRKLFLCSVFMFVYFFVKAQDNDTLTLSIKDRPVEYEYFSAPDSVGNRAFLFTSASQPSNVKTQVAELKLPYPVLFIHGLNSNADTWLPTTSYLKNNYHWTNGGRFDYCLNSDGDNKTSNKRFYPATGADITVFAGTWIVGDYYYVNFDVGLNGSYHPRTSDHNYVLSNQSAIAKQGRALKDAIKRVLLLTGRDKVILVGHSMGGLAAREYLQNADNWQSDGKHHVAKLVTTGTPHGGSNTTSFGGLSGDTEGQSEAIRDLRRDFYYTGNPGVYLFGGPEKLPYMKDQVCCRFYNADVNCNGISEENIVGLNQKAIVKDLDYACIIGECGGCIATKHPGDGIVWDACADLNNYYSNITKNVFYYYGSDIVQIHTDLPGQIFQNMQGMDEPESYPLAYQVEIDKTYMGYITPQSLNSSDFPKDIDLYKFKITNDATINLSISNSSLPNLSARLFNSSQVAISGAYSKTGTSIDFSQFLTAGDYYFRISGTETATHHSSYTFKINKNTTLTNVDDFNELLTSSSIYPNPANSDFIFRTSIKESVSIDFYDMEGQHKLSSIVKDNDQIDVSTMEGGVYILSIKSGEYFVNKKLVIVK